MLLEVDDLRIAFTIDGRRSVPVRGVSLQIPERARIAIVGESGCGKSLTALALGGLVERAEISGAVRGSPKIAYVFQNPMQSLNPVLRVFRQLEEALPSRRDADGIVGGLLSAVGLPAATARKYPCELSGGQQQRVMIAMALAQEPDLLIADEPTTALDVTTQQEVLELIYRVAAERGTTVVHITHNLGLVADFSEYVYVMYAGEVVERGPVTRVLSRPYHPYTRGLLAAVPRLGQPKDAPLVGIPGTVPPPWNWPEGCAFRPRCPYASEACSKV